MIFFVSLVGRCICCCLVGAWTWSLSKYLNPPSLSLPPVNLPFRPKGQRTKGPSALPPFDIVVTQIIITINIIIILHPCYNTDGFESSFCLMQERNYLIATLLFISLSTAEFDTSIANIQTDTERSSANTE